MASGSQGDSGRKEQERAEKQRLRQEQQLRELEEKRAKEARKVEERETKELQQESAILAEIQEAIDELALMLAANRYNDAFLQDYVNEMGQRLVPREAPAGVKFSFRVVDDPSPNALALPDGRIYVNSGLLVFVENEAQLAVVLGHEIGHVVERHQLEAIREERSLKRKVLPAIIGAGIGAAIGAVKGKEGAAEGAAIGATAATVYSALARNAYSRQQEDEADAYGARLALAQNYDPAAGVAFFELLIRTFGDKDRFSTLAWGSHSRNVDRAAHIRSLLDGELASIYNQRRTAGNLTVGSGQMYLYSSRMLRDVALDYMDRFDRYDVAKRLLDAIVEYRVRDPKTVWAIGRTYKMVGRSDTDRGKALDYLQRAVQLDERNRYPFVHRDLGLMLARSGPDSMPAAIEALKQYIRAHMDKNGAYPPDIDEMYDYLLVFGDSKWVAPRLESTVVAAAGRSEPVPADRPPRAQPSGRPSRVPTRVVLPGSNPR